MKVTIATATVFAVLNLAGCGDAVSIDPAEREAEDERREIARDADVADMVKTRKAADEVYARDRDAKAAAADDTSDGKRIPD